jgi:putative tricarboxylic transport membrane protein
LNNGKLNMRLVSLVFIGLYSFGGASAAVPAWSPQKNVEIVVGSAPGGSNDKTAAHRRARLTQMKLVPTSVTVANKPGGGSNIAFTYVQQHAGDPHILLVGTPSLLTNHITGLRNCITAITPRSPRFSTTTSSSR